jgi:hypothetical protein
MANPENLIGKGFDAHPENINKQGRPLKLFTILKDCGFSKSDGREAIHQLFWSNETLEETIASPSSPPIMKIVAGVMKDAIAKKKWYIVQDLFTQAYGQPKQEIEQQVNITAFKVKFNNDGDNISEGGL